MDEIEYLPGTTIPRDPVIEAYKKDIDVSLLIMNRKLTVTQRIQRLQEAHDSVMLLRKAVRDSRRRAS